jgi:hypothetical protein
MERRRAIDWIRIENFFGKIKEFKLIALRADKTDRSFAIEREAHVRAPRWLAISNFSGTKASINRRRVV